MLFFRSEEHVTNWCRQWKLEQGALLSLDQLWRLADAWYSPDRREASWRRFTLEEAETILRSLGLTSSFWSVR